MNTPEHADPAGPSDAECVVTSRDGSPDQFQPLVERYQRPLLSFLTAHLGNRSEAEEAAQESFVRAFLSLKKLRKPESFYAWLLGIGSRVVKEQFRASESQQLARNTTPESEIADSYEPQAAEEYPLEEALAALPESYRRVLLLRYYEELSCAEISEQLAMPLGTVTKTLSRAYALLRQELQSHDRERPETSMVRGSADGPCERPAVRRVMPALPFL